MISFTDAFSGAWYHLESWHRALPPFSLNIANVIIFVAVVSQFMKIRLLLVEMTYYPPIVPNVLTETLHYQRTSQEGNSRQPGHQ